MPPAGEGQQGRAAEANPTAREIIFRSGALDAPFDVPRAVAIRALEKLDWRPDESEVLMMNNKVAELKKIEDGKGEMIVYRLLARSGNRSVLNQLIDTCKQWIVDCREPGTLLGIALDNYPDPSQHIIREVFLSVRDEAQVWRKDKALSNELCQNFCALTIRRSWLDSDMIIDATSDVLCAMHPPRHKTIEQMWIEVVGSLKRCAPDKQKHRLTDFGERVSRDCCGPETSCTECLRNFRNQPYHEELKRGLAKDFLEKINQ